MNTLDPVRTAAMKSQVTTDSIGSLAEIQSMRMANPAHGARQDAANFRDCVNELFKGEKYDGFRAKVQDIDMTVHYLNSPTVSRPVETITSSLLTVRQEMTAIIMAIEKKPDPRLAAVVSSFTDLERSSTALALQEQKERKMSAASEKNNSKTACMLLSKLAAHPLENSQNTRTALLSLG